MTLFCRFCCLLHVQTLRHPFIQFARLRATCPLPMARELEEHYDAVIITFPGYMCTYISIIILISVGVEVVIVVDLWNRPGVSRYWFTRRFKWSGLLKSKCEEGGRRSSLAHESNQFHFINQCQTAGEERSPSLAASCEAIRIIKHWIVCGVTGPRVSEPPSLWWSIGQGQSWRQAPNGTSHEHRYAVVLFTSSC